MRPTATNPANGSIEAFRREVARFLATPSAPPLALAGRGIVTSAGGECYFVNAYVGCRLLRRLGCRLPIEWFYLGPRDMTPEMVALAEEIPGVRCVDLSPWTAIGTDHRKERGGYQSKPLAILKSSFRQVLFLDADNFADRAPDDLFDEPAFTQHGALLWPDYWHWEDERKPRLEEVFQVVLGPELQHESGQLMFDKTRCWQALNLACLYNRLSDVSYRYVFGDKDTFALAFRRLDAPFHTLPGPPGGVAGMILQRDPRGRVLFRHCVQTKWGLSGRPSMAAQHFPHRETCRQFIFELQKKWSSRWQPYPRPARIAALDGAAAERN